MSRIDLLRKNYQRICGLPWDLHVAGPQRVWLAVYDKEDERKLRLRLGLFKEVTEHLGHQWHEIDFTNTFADWLCTPPYSDYAESYFDSPSRLGAAPLAAFKKTVVGFLLQTLQAVEQANNTVVAVYGVASLFGFLRISELLPMIEMNIKGRLLVFFPGVYEQDNYRLLDARDGWNYHAVPITASEGEIRK
jgi:hypothetical protein